MRRSETENTPDEPTEMTILTSPVNQDAIFSPEMGTPPSAYLRLNVGGRSFVISEKRLSALPESRLSEFLRASNEEKMLLCDGYFSDSDEFYFDRSGDLFDSVANTYRTGLVHIPEFACHTQITNELKFWKIDNYQISPCCLHKIDDSHSTVINNGLETDSTRKPIRHSTTSSYGPFSELSCGKIRYQLWQIMEKPSSSKYALAFMIISCILVSITMIVLVMSSMETFRVYDSNLNQTVTSPVLDTIDSVCVVSFTVEYLARLWASCDRWEYLRSGLSVIDLVAILPFYIELFLGIIGVEDRLFAQMRRSILLVRLLRVMRVLRALRILKVARYSMGFQSMGETLKRSWRELALLIMFMLTTNLMFSTAMYFIEHDHPKTHFTNIPSACWWCIITMTTVGYGDVFPQTIGGKVLASAVSVTGIILLAFPISVIVDTFNQEYQERQGTDNKDDQDPEAVARLAQEMNQSVRVIDGKVFIEVKHAHRRKAGKMF